MKRPAIASVTSRLRLGLAATTGEREHDEQAQEERTAQQLSHPRVDPLSPRVAPAEPGAGYGRRTRRPSPSWTCASTAAGA